VLSLRFASDKPVLEAVWHGTFTSISAFCNAGFDLQGSFASMAAYNDSILVNLVLIGLIQAGSLSFVVFSDLSQSRSWSRLSLDTKLVISVNLLLILGGTAAFLIAEWNNGLAGVDTTSKPLAALFQNVAARTAGFATIGFADLHAVTLFAWVGIMMVGGAAGSTAGGVKLNTVGVIFAAVIATLRGQSEPHIFNRRIPAGLVFRAMAVIAIFVSVHFLFTVMLAITEDVFAPTQDIAFIALMFEAMSAMATVGLSTGVTPSLSTLGKLVLSLAMIFGRLGPLSVAYALQRKQHADPFRLPEAAVRIG
jgi:trk system potassium uptake protein TrkH